MAMADTYHIRTLERRAARTRRSKWLSRIIFSLSGFGLMLFLRFNPEVALDVVTWVEIQRENSEVARDLSLPQVRIMPLDRVVVRRGTQTEPRPQVSSKDAQAQADSVSHTLQNFKVGG